MRRRDAKALVADSVSVEAGAELSAARVHGFPQYWYVTAGPTGSAWVVDESTGDIATVPASQAPEDSCAAVDAQRASGAMR